ncbi:toxin-antitoxin system YwqK family antitoxin [Kordia sp.]|uniref:toxin-antitoxin system YwqK family antitoxin n=1 Tax=Kordia sp. TaxID=1965332 RepID=UPI003D2CE2C9
MVLKEHSLNNLSIYLTKKKFNSAVISLLILSSLIGCKPENEHTVGKEVTVFNYTINTSDIPKDTVAFSNPKLLFINGIYYLNNVTYSGIIYKELKGNKIKTFSSVLNGKLHGTFKSFHENNTIYEIRNYKNNVSLGKQTGYWQTTGKLKFEYNYFNDKKEGIQKSWYSNGNIAYIYNYRDDKQDGFQKAWRQNGSLYRNFQVKNGIRYGLQKSKSCATIQDGKIQ